MTDPLADVTADRPTIDRLVQAVAEALRQYESIDFADRAGYTERDLTNVAALAVAAAHPIIEAEVRESIAAAIEALPYDVAVPDTYIAIDYQSGYDHGNRDAARIAEGTDR